MDNKELGLYDKYVVYKLVGNPESNDFGAEVVEDWVFVLNPTTDPGAEFALLAYSVWAARNGYQQLSDDIRRKIGREPYVPMICGNE